MSASGLIKQKAVEIANQIKESAAGLEKEKAQLELRALEIKARLQSASLTDKRAMHFRPEIGGKLQCPRCWVSNEVSTPLTPMSGTAKEDFFQCKTCGFQISIPE